MKRRDMFKALAAVAVAPIATAQRPEAKEPETVVRCGCPNIPIIEGDIWARRAGKSAYVWEAARDFALRKPDKKVGIYTPDGLFTLQFKPKA